MDSIKMELPRFYHNHWLRAAVSLRPSIRLRMMLATKATARRSRRLSFAPCWPREPSCRDFTRKRDRLNWLRSARSSKRKLLWVKVDWRKWTQIKMARYAVPCRHGIVSQRPLSPKMSSLSSASPPFPSRLKRSKKALKLRIITMVNRLISCSVILLSAGIYPRIELRCASAASPSKWSAPTKIGHLIRCTALTIPASLGFKICCRMVKSIYSCYIKLHHAT